MQKELILVGGGGHCRSVAEAARAQGWHIKGVLDPAMKPGEESFGLICLGDDDSIPQFADECEFICTVGAIGVPELRNKIISKMEKTGVKFATVIAPTAYVATDAVIGEGTVVLNRVVINANVKIGRNVILNTGSIVEHDSTVGDSTHVSTGAIMNGNCHVGRDCFVASGSIMMHGTSIGDRVVVGVGSTVSKNLTEPGVYLGSPARKIK